MRGSLVALFLLASAAAQAAPACYGPAEIEADQAVQFQTELMVVSGACQTRNYTDFLHRNSAIIATYQNQLIVHFRRDSGKHAEQVFETYLTHLANESALRAGDQGVAELCAKSADWLKSTDALGPEDFRRLISSRAVVRSASYRRCGGDVGGPVSAQNGVKPPATE
jgi:hypothetical protein